MKIQFIYTFDTKPQMITAYEHIFPAFLESKNVLTAYAMTRLNKKEKSDLIKISCCVVEAKEMPICPEWYEKENGKIWVDYLEEWKKINGIKSTVSTEYINEFNS